MSSKEDKMEEPSDDAAYDMSDGPWFHEQRDLDVIEVAGDLKTGQLKALALALGLTWAIDVALALEDKEKTGAAFLALWGFLGTYDNSPMPSDAEWAMHIGQLVAWGVLRKLVNPPHVPRIYFRYFEVPKSGNVNRTIFDGSWAKTHWSKPGRVGLPTVAITMEVLSMLPNAVFVCSDIRSWFHVIPLPEAVRRLFSVTLEGDPDGVIYELNVTPMGHPACCRHAQICAWIMILSSPPAGTRPDLSGCKDDPPPFVWFLNSKGERVGVLFLWIDNVFFAAANQVIAESFAKRLKELQKGGPRDCGITWKELEVGKTCTFLGMLIGWHNGVLYWKHKDGNVKRWKELTEKPIKTVHDVQMRLGVISWDVCVRNLAFAEVRELLDLMPKQSTSRACKASHTLTSQQIESINARLQALCKNSGVSRGRFAIPKTQIFAFSDATLVRRAFFLCDAQGNVVGAEVIGPATTAVDIYEEESDTALDAIMKGWEVADHVNLGCDNMNTVFSYQRRNAKRRSVCARILMLEGKPGKSFSIVYVPTDDMPADGLTRANKAEFWRGEWYQGKGYAIERHKIAVALERVKPFAPGEKSRKRDE